MASGDNIYSQLNIEKKKKKRLATVNQEQQGRRRQDIRCQHC